MKIICCVQLVWLLLNFNIIIGKEKLNYSKFEEITYSIDQFKITGNLYFPETNNFKGAVIWVHGDGPDKRSNSFPGTKFFNVFLDNGYAYFRYDKPGSGDSEGKLRTQNLFEERAKIVSKTVDVLKDIPSLKNKRIGLVGSSQAGYVLPIVLSERNDIDFMIGLSLPAMNSKEQWAYLLKKQMICEGYSKKQAEDFSAAHLKMMNSKTKKEFLECIKYFENNPISLSAVKGYNKDFGTNVKNWWPLNWAEYQSFNPENLIAQIEIPVLSIFGEKDTQVDPIQGSKSYRQNLTSGGNKFFEVVLLPKTNHNMSLAETGCLKEQKMRKKWVISPELEFVTKNWMTKLDKYLRLDK